MNDDTLRDKAREAIRAGTLPGRRPERMWGGPGNGACCSICDKPVMCDEVGFELEFDRGDGDSSFGNYTVHIQCFAAWECEYLPLPAASGHGTIARSERNSPRGGESA